MKTTMISLFLALAFTCQVSAGTNQPVTNPVPADGDEHAVVEGNNIFLQWKHAPDSTIQSQYLYFSTDSNAVASGRAACDTLTLQTQYMKKQLHCINVYYWRVDQKTIDGTIIEGDVWSFQPRHLAFPEAEGYGRFAKGGRGGRVVYVTNLNNSGPGSFREALTDGGGPRTILFNVSGIIDMNLERLFVDDDVTVAGQSAPGKGICIAHADIGFGDDNICRFLRVRRGAGKTGNAMGVAGGDHIMIDHVSACWGTDETFSSRNAKNITFQRSMIAEALGIAGHSHYRAGTNHGYAATIGGEIGSFHHNLLVDCAGRNWSMGGGLDKKAHYKGRLDLFNNVVYNWNKRTTDGGAHEVNFVANYYKMGPDTQHKVLFTLEIEGNFKGTQTCYVSGNIRENQDGSLSGDQLNDTYLCRIRDGRDSLTWEPFVNKPFFPSYAKIQTAQEAYKDVLSDMGANLPMVDDHDKRMVYETLNGTYTYVGSKSGIRGEIDNESDCGGFEDYPQESWPEDFDTDKDGLPNWWERIYGTDLHSTDFSDSNSDDNQDGYTLLEDYLDFIAHPHVCLSAREKSTVDMKPYFEGYTLQPQYSYSNESINENVSVSQNGSILTLKALNKPGIATITMKVKDAEGSTCERMFKVAVMK